MIITAANDYVADIHDRMPVILEQAPLDAWRDRSTGTDLLMPAANDLLARWPASKRVNSFLVFRGERLQVSNSTARQQGYRHLTGCRHLTVNVIAIGR
jgi:putative SOS response-associated peptidase YedK